MANESAFALRTEHITLGQLLKATGIADSGTDARALLEVGGIRVNGEEEIRRGRKLYVGDTVELSDGSIVTITS